MSQAMKITARRALILLLALPLAGCSYWQAQPGNLREILGDPELEHIRLTHTDGSRTEARIAELQGDTIYGTRGSSGGVTCYEAAASCTLRVPIEEVGFVERRRFSIIKSLAMVLVPIGFVFAISAK